jgi:hypothetical protein
MFDPTHKPTRCIACGKNIDTRKPETRNGYIHPKCEPLEYQTPFMKGLVKGGGK